MSSRHLHLNVNGNGLAKPPESWKYSDPPTWFLDFASWERLGQIAERGFLDAVFLADVLPSVDFTKPWHAFDPFMVQTAIARATERIGLVATLTTTFREAYDIARLTATLDVASNGRAAVNIVTSGSDDAALQYGRGILPDRDFRYGRADEILVAVKELWDSWQPDALVADPAAGVLVDETKVHQVEFNGSYVNFAARFQFPRSRQGRPVVVQAGGSPQGIDLAAKHADAVFCMAESIATGREFYRTVKARAAAHGRSSDELLILPGLNVTLGGTEAEAWERRNTLAADHERRHHTLAEILGVPFELLELDKALPWDYVNGPHWNPRTIGGAKAVLDWAQNEDLTVRQLLDRGAGAQLAFVGTPEQVADTIETWYSERAADGFNLNFDIFPSGLEAIVDQLVPELQKRGIFRREYTSDTLRGHYGLPVYVPPATATSGRWMDTA